MIGIIYIKYIFFGDIYSYLSVIFKYVCRAPI